MRAEKLDRFETIEMLERLGKLEGIERCLRGLSCFRGLKKLDLLDKGCTGGEG